MFYYAPDAEQQWVWITPGLGAGDSAVAARVARVQVLRHTLFIVQRDVRRNRRHHHSDDLVLCLRPCGPCRRRAEFRNRTCVAIRQGALAKRSAEDRRRSPRKSRKSSAPARCALRSRPRTAISTTTFRRRTVCGDPRDRARASEWILGGFVLGEAAVLTYARLRSRLKKLRT